MLQPNIRLTKAAYWDFIDHSLPLTERSLTEALTLTGFEVETMTVRFLPYTTESRFPISPTLIRLYLRLPPAQWLLGKQTFVVARRIGRLSARTRRGPGRGHGSGRIRLCRGPASGAVAGDRSRPFTSPAEAAVEACCMQWAVPPGTSTPARASSTAGR